MPTDASLAIPDGLTDHGPVLPPSHRAVTLADIAQRAGVSKVAVSVVLNNANSKVRVSPATRERILAAAQALQYRPNAVARSLRLRRTNIFAFYSAQGYGFNPSFPFYGALLAGLFAGCEEHQKEFLVHGTFRGLSEDDIFTALLNGQIDGLILYTRAANSLTEKLVQSRLPVVTVVHEVEGLPCVSIDNRQGGRMLACYLGKKGYSRVLCRYTASEMPTTLQRRLNGFCEEAAKYEMQITHSRSDSQLPCDKERQLLSSLQTRPQAIVAYSDYSADGVVEYCRLNDLRVPEDVAVVGFDHLRPTQRPARQLTTVSAPWQEVARQAVSLLVARCNGKEVPNHLELPVELVLGDTA